MPSRPERTYANKGWTNWGDFFGTGTVYGAAAYGLRQWQVEKRADPSAGRWKGAASDYRVRTNGSNFNCTALTLSNANRYNCRWNASASGLTGGQSVWLSSRFVNTVQLYADAEL